MAAPGTVEFPGKQRQRMRMRGTKHANKDTQVRLRKNLVKLLEDSNELLPTMTWSGKLSWGRTDPVTKTLNQIYKVLRKRHDRKWLSKKMMSKRGDPLAKAWAGSLVAAHDEDITIVGDFNHPSFGKASFVRRGDGKPLYLAAIQNHHLPTLRMAAWERHAKRGFHFFSWKGGLVCSGPNAIIPEGWLEDVLHRSRFDFLSKNKIWHTKGLDFDSVKKGIQCNGGYVLLEFTNECLVAIEFEMFRKKNKDSFIHHLALSLLPPNLLSVLKPKVVWLPKGYNGPMNECLDDEIQKIYDAWIGLTLSEDRIDDRLKKTVMNHVEEGFLVGEKWFENAEDALKELSGSQSERILATHMVKMAAGSGIRIDLKGGVSERKGNAIEIEAASLNNVLQALWDEYGLKGLECYGLNGADAEILWEEQGLKKKGFGRFLKNLEKQRQYSMKMSVFPYKKGEVAGIVGEINNLVLEGLVHGVGKAEKSAISNRGSIESAASSWAWLVAVGRSTGKEWQFEKDARDKGGAWAHSVKILVESGKSLLNDEKTDYKKSLDALHKITGQNEPLP